jgi:hypothetical protein
VTGESTAAPGAGSGEVLQVNASAMTLVRSIPLAQSTKPDAENQGRGLPNYLGAAAISPEAWRRGSLPSWTTSAAACCATACR